MVTPLFSGIPAAGEIARTVTNIKNGASSPIAGMTHAIFVLIVLLVLAPYASYVALASLAPVLMVVAWNISKRTVCKGDKRKIISFTGFTYDIFVNSVYKLDNWNSRRVVLMWYTLYGEKEPRKTKAIKKNRLT